MEKQINTLDEDIYQRYENANLNVLEYLQRGIK